MAIIDFPANITPDSEQWTPSFNTQSFTSSLNRAEQTKVMPGAKWQATLMFNNRVGKDAGALRGFIASLQGKAGRFWLIPSDWKQQGTVSGSGVLAEQMTQGATSIKTSGWEGHQPELLCAGDWFEINGELKYTTKPAASDANGDATIEFSPPARVTVAAGTAIRYYEPRCQMKLVDDAIGWQVSSPVIYSLTLECEEAIDV